MKVKRALLIIGMLVGCAVLVRGANGITYQTEVDVEFTFNSQLSMTVTGANDGIVITNLIPGNSDKSNTATVTVTTNSVLGYTLTATLGDGNTYTNNNLVHTSANATFASLATSDRYTLSGLAGLSANKWGYALGTVADSTTEYRGLAYGDTLINATTDVSGTARTGYDGTNQTKFTIAAKALATQPSGTYRNVVTFTALANVTPQTLEQSYAAAGKSKYNGFYKMQDMTTAICSATEAVDGPSQMRAIDVRDGSIYWITKLQDGHCWMTQNLDLDLDSGTTYTSADTDLPSGTTWQPTNSTTQLNSDGQTFPSVGDDSDTTNNYIPKSLNTGDWYYAGYNNSLLAATTVNYLTSTNRTNTNGLIDVNNGSGVNYFSNGPFDNNGMHGHVGNYYNWSSAVASNDTSGYTTSTYGNVANNPQRSICPAGWRLPTITSAAPTYSSPNSKNEFRRLVYLYNNDSFTSTDKLEDAPLFFARGGSAAASSLSNPGNKVFYWSSTVYNGTRAYVFYLTANNGSATDYHSRADNLPVRCVAK